MCETHYPGVAQLVGRLVWDQDAASSSLATRTNKKGRAKALPFLLVRVRDENHLTATVRDLQRMLFYKIQQTIICPLNTLIFVLK